MNLKLNQNLEKVFFYIVASLPILIIFGSGIINISVVFLNIIFFVHIISTRNFRFFNDNRVYFLILLSFLIFQVLNNFLNLNFIYFDKSIYYLRFLLLPLVFKYFSKFIKFDFLKLSKIYLIILMLIIFDLFYQYIFDVNLIGFKPGLYNFDQDIYERYSGIFNNELILGSYLSSFGFLIISFFFCFNKRNNFYLLILLSILFFSILITGERSSLMNIIISIIFIFLFIKPLRFKLTILGLTFLAISIIGINFSDQLKLRYFDYPLRVLLNESENNQIENNHFKTLNLKSAYSNFINKTHWGMHYKTASSMFYDKPINGHGFKQFRIKCENYSFLFSKKLLNEAATKNGCSTHPHHYILEILSEQGIIGLIIFFLSVFILIKDILIRTDDKIYVIFLFSIILGYMLPIKPSGSIISTWSASIFWLLLSFGYIKNKKKI